MGHSQPLRIEDNTVESFITSRTINSRLWFVNNKKFEARVLGYIAKAQQNCSAVLFSVVFQGNHIHILALFPLDNRADFMRNVNARTAEAVRYTVDEFEGGPVFERRYSEQSVVTDSDIQDRFLYCALQPVNAGLCKKISEYPGYNSFADASSQIVREYKVIDWTGYNKTKKYNPDVRIVDYTKYYPLKYSKLPQYADLSRKDYKEKVHALVEERRLTIVNKKLGEGYYYPDPSILKEVKPGSFPRQTKKNKPYEAAPQIFCSDIEVRKERLAHRKTICLQYRDASKAYLAGAEFVKFPPNTYKPPCFMIKPPPILA